jgi:hypothetical protein
MSIYDSYDPEKLSFSKLTEEVFYAGVPLGMSMEQLADFRVITGGGNILTIIMDRYYEVLPEWRNVRLDEIL